MIYLGPTWSNMVQPEMRNAPKSPFLYGKWWCTIGTMKFEILGFSDQPTAMKPGWMIHDLHEDLRPATLRQTLRGTKELELRRAVRSGSWFEIDLFAESCWDRAGIYVYNFVYISLECLATVYFKADCVPRSWRSIRFAESDMVFICIHSLRG